MYASTAHRVFPANKTGGNGIAGTAIHWIQDTPGLYWPQ
jgi:hypothetical protein